VVLEQIRRMLLAGLGVVFYTREKVEEVVKQLVETGQLTKEQGAKILDELVAKGRDGQEAIVTTLVERIAPLLASVTPVSKSAFDSLVARVNDLAMRIDTLERRILLGENQPPERFDSPGPPPPPEEPPRASPTQ